MAVAFGAAFALMGCGDEENDDPSPIKKQPFSTLSQVSLPNLSCVLNYGSGDTLRAAQLKRGKDVIDLTFGYDPYSVLEKSTVDMEDYTHNYQDVELKKGQVVKMVSGNSAKPDSVIYSYEKARLKTARIVAWENDTTKHVYDKTYVWNVDSLSKVSIRRQTFVGADSVSVPQLDEYTFSYRMAGGPVVQWQFFFPIIMDVDFSWAGYAELFFSPKTNGVPYNCKALHYPDANDLSKVTRRTFSIAEVERKTSSVSYEISCQENGGAYWQKRCTLVY